MTSFRIEAALVVNEKLRNKLIKHGWEETTIKIGGQKIKGWVKTFAVK
ncbi:MAG: hypothetical protein AABO41_06960 [Acidobacteriota bacterium]